MLQLNFYNCMDKEIKLLGYRKYIFAKPSRKKQVCAAGKYIERRTPKRNPFVPNK
jgi:hypothetical protein